MTNIRLILIIAISFYSCKRTKNAPADSNMRVLIENRITKPAFQSIIDSADVIGAKLLYDFKKDIDYSNNFEWADTGKLPASTFKVANSIIGLETGVIESDSAFFKWDGKPKGNKNWEQDLILRDAFHLSCVSVTKILPEKLVKNG